MQTLAIRNTVFGDGIPKICVPITGNTKEEILNHANEIATFQPDCIEWRVDWYENYTNYEDILYLLKELRKLFHEKILIFTFRTKKEGGQAQLSYKEYETLNLSVAKTGLVDFIDVEAFSFGEISETLIDKIHVCGAKVIASNHDFNRTPSFDEMLNRLRKLQNINADIPKLAVMPKSPDDVLTLLNATRTMITEFADRPIITMSMAGTGFISRMTGEIFGSAVTFASVTRATAPGQPHISDLRPALNLIHTMLKES